MDATLLTATLNAARAFERLGWLRSEDWERLGVTLLVAGIDDSDVVSLAILDANPTGWDTEEPTANLFARYSVQAPDSVEATETVARVLAADLRARPARVSSPMIRMLSKVAGPSYDSPLANRALGEEEYLDCTCVVSGDDTFEADLEALTSVKLPDEIVRILAANLRQTLPSEQPPHIH